MWMKEMIWTQHGGGEEGDLTAATFIYKQMWIMSVRMLSLDFECGSNFVEKCSSGIVGMKKKFAD